MAGIDDELLLDAEEDAREAEYIEQQLPSDLKERFTRDDILHLMELIVEYYVESGVLEEGDGDEVEIDLDQVAEAVCRKAGDSRFVPEDVFFVVQADLDYQEQNL